MAKGYKLTAAAVKKTADTARWAMAQPRATVGDRTKPNPDTQIFHAKISAVTAIDSNTKWKYTIDIGYWDMSTSPSTGGTWTATSSGTLYAITAFEDGKLPVNAYILVTPRGYDTATGQIYYTVVKATGSFKARITAVSGSFPVWTYTVQRVIGIDTTLTDYTRRVTDGVNLTAFNACEWTPASYAYIHGNGLMIQDSLGSVATTYAGGTAGTCVIRPIGVGNVVDVTAYSDQSGNVVYEFSVPNSAQA